MSILGNKISFKKPPETEFNCSLSLLCVDGGHFQDSSVRCQKTLSLPQTGPEFALTSFLSTLGSGTSLGSCKANHQGFGDVDPAGS